LEKEAEAEATNKQTYIVKWRIVEVVSPSKRKK
jgi:hypothetical protein